MSSDWNEPRDKGPPIEEPDLNRKRARKGSKRFAIERRYLGPDRKFLAQFYNREWHIDRRYHTAKQRDQGLAAMIHRSKNSHVIYERWEYRCLDL